MARPYVVRIIFTNEQLPDVTTKTYAILALLLAGLESAGVLCDLHDDKANDIAASFFVRAPNGTHDTYTWATETAAHLERIGLTAYAYVAPKECAL